MSQDNNLESLGANYSQTRKSLTLVRIAAKNRIASSEADPAAANLALEAAKAAAREGRISESEIHEAIVWGERLGRELAEEIIAENARLAARLASGLRERGFESARRDGGDVTLSAADLHALLSDEEPEASDSMTLGHAVHEAALSAEACPGCGCLPGDGRTAGCSHPDGCGYAHSQELDDLAFG